ncbi:hypothetical protein ACIPUD_10630 [Bradyrhizobium sp. CAR08]
MTEPALTRKPHQDPQRPGWDVYFGDVHIGHIGERAGVPKDIDQQWDWSLSFYPGAGAGQDKGGIGVSFEECRMAFERAWQNLKPKITEADYERWRDQRDGTAWKKRMWSEKLLLPTQTRAGRSRCFCGTEITTTSIPDHVRTAHRGIGAK